MEMTLTAPVSRLKVKSATASAWPTVPPVCAPSEPMKATLTIFSLGAYVLPL